MTTKFGPTEVTVTEISRIHEGQLEISGLSIQEIFMGFNYLQLARHLFVKMGAEDFDRWPDPADLAYEKTFRLFDPAVPSLRVFQTCVGLVPQHENHWADALSLMSTGVVAMAFWGRWTMGKKIEVAASLSSSSLAHFFLKIFQGREPHAYETQALDQVMVIHAENELNFSTCGLRFAASTGAAFRDAIASACGILSGPLHGGASLEVMRIFDEIDRPSEVKSWLDSALRRRERIFGFGHLLYKQGDPRAVLLKGLAERLAKDSGSHEIYDLAENLSEEVFKTKQLRPNIDFYSAVIYKMLGIPQTLAPGIFGMSRMLGWALHYDEQNRVKAMITPTARFVSQ